MGNVPKLRFPEFKEEWDRKKLREVAEINPSNKSLPEKFIYIDLESVSNGVLLKENEISSDEAPSRAQRILKECDVLFQMVRPYQMNNLYFNSIGNYVASTGYAQIRTQQNSMFVFQYLHFKKFVDKVIERCTGTSYPAINSTDLSNITISFPTLPEQTRIASFFTVIDKKIAQLKQKKALLEQYKKGVMQKLFSQELRFKDEKGKAFPEWEKKKLGEVADNIQSGKNKTDENGEYDLHGSMGIIGKCYNHSYNGKFILIARVGANAGSINIVEGKFGVSDNTLVVSNNKIWDVYFMYFLLISKNLNKLVFGSGQPLITGGQLKSLNILLPLYAEQTKIANFLSAIDEKINRIGNQIQQTQEYKKGLLQNMFC